MLVDICVNYTYLKRIGACQALMLMLNIIQKRLTDDWLIDWSLPSSLSFDNEEDVVIKSKPYNRFSLLSAFLAINQRCFLGFTGWKQLFRPSKPYTKELYTNISETERKLTYYIRRWSEFLHDPKGIVVSFLQNL